MAWRVMPRRRPLEQRETAQGAGVVVSADGYALTHNHESSSTDDLRRSLEERGAAPRLLLAMRGGHTRYVAVEPQDR